MRRDDLLRRTFFYDSLRHIFQGPMDAMFLGIFLVIAIRFFHASVAWKAFFVTLCWAGGIFSPWIVQWISRFAYTATQMGGIFFLGTGICFLWASCAKSFSSYIILMAIASIFYRSEGPILINMYVRNYPDNRRATYFSITMMFAALASILFSQWSGYMLDKNLHYYRILLVVTSVCAFLCSLCFLRIPSPPMGMEKAQRKKCHYLRYLLTDRRFAKLSLHSFIIGFSYQMLIPMRIEHLANVRYGMELSNLSIMLLTLAIPNAVRVLGTPIWGRFFDRCPLIPMRIAVGLFAFFGYLLFFHSREFGFLLCGGSFLGAAMAGSFILHNLWIARIVDLDKVAAYMSVYVLITGIRSILAPIAGYAILSISSPVFVSDVGAILILIAIVGFWSMRNDKSIR
ncbi:MAG: MFS transporter [Puniceicoccales bacterium]|jgi:MFS family permease|nr:MFS transporter [Puniceicoccales bacterium]